jgi:HAD superfamily hydrolase (TIGR01509 family)
MLAGVFFDLDETLIDAGACHREAGSRTFAAFGMDWDEALKRTGPFYGRRMREILEARRNALGVDERAAPLDELVALRESHYVDVFPEGVSLLAGAREALASVRDRGAMAAVVSSSVRRTIELIVNHYGLSRFITFVVGGDEVERGKPAPDCYELAFRRLQSWRRAAKHECLVVEDSAVGVAAATSAGLPACLVPRYPLTEPVKPAYTLSSLEQFPGLVASLA